MAVTQSVKVHSGNAGAASSYQTASWTPAADKVHIVFVTTRKDSGSPGQPSISGNGITWNYIGRGNSTAGSNNSGVAAFWGISSSPTTGVLTITTGSVNGCVWSITELTNANPVTPVRQSDSAINSGNAATLATTLSAFLNANSVMIAGFSTLSSTAYNIADSPASGISDDKFYNSTVQLTSFYGGSDTSPSVTRNSGTGISAGISMEIIMQNTPSSTLTETITITDTFLRSITKVFAVTVSIVETLVTEYIQGIITKVVSDTITITDTFLRQITRLFSDTINNSEIFSAVRTAYKNITETITVTVAQFSKTYGIVRTEVASISASLIKTFQRAISEAISLSDTSEFSFVYFRELTENISISEAITKTCSIVRSEIVSTVDSFSRAVTKIVSLTSQITISDAISSVRIFARELIESISITDSIGYFKKIALFIFGKISGVSSIGKINSEKQQAKITSVNMSGKIGGEKDAGKIDHINFNGKIK